MSWRLLQARGNAWDFARLPLLVAGVVLLEAAHWVGVRCGWAEPDPPPVAPQPQPVSVDGYAPEGSPA